MWLQFKTLMPSFVVYWFALSALALGAWYYWTRIYPNFKFGWKAPLLVASTFWAYTTLTSAVAIYQNGEIYAVQQQMKAQSQAQGQPGQPPPPGQPGQPGQAQQSSVAPEDPMMKMKGEFLKSVEMVIRNPETNTPEFKKKVFADFKDLIPKDKAARAEFAKPLLNLINCQRYFWEDALASYKSKKVIKSESRVACENLDGAFFGRKTLVPPEGIARNEEMLNKFAKHEQVPGPDGKPVDVKEDLLREAYDAESRAHSNVKALLE
jgi:hypothetical protein